MRDKRIWIALKALLILLLIISIYLTPTTDRFRIFIRFGMLAVFTFSLIADIIDWQKNRK